MLSYGISRCQFVNHCLVGFRIMWGDFKRHRLPVPILKYSNSKGLFCFVSKFCANAYGQSDMGCLSASL